MPTRIVAIDSFDSPNSLVIKPKKNVQAVARVPYPNPGPEIQRNRDRKGTFGQPGSMGVQEVQLLMLTSGPNPLLQASGFPVPPVGAAPILAPWRNDTTPNGHVIGVVNSMARARYYGYHNRDDTVSVRVSIDPRIQIIWTQSVPRATAYANDVSDRTYPGGVRARRVRINVKDEFVSPYGTPVAPIYTGRERYIWCPTGIRRGDVQMGADPHAMTAIGCTCRDMLMRGLVEARYGCKHIIAYNRAQATGNLV